MGEEGRICDMWTARPVSVESTRRWASDLWPVKRSGVCAVDMVDEGGGNKLGPRSEVSLGLS